MGLYLPCRTFASPSAAGIGVPLVPTEGRDEPRKTAKYGKPTQMATLPFFVSFYTALRQGSGTELQVKSMALLVGQVKNGKMFFLQQIRKHTKAPQNHRPKDNHQLSTINYPLLSIPHTLPRVKKFNIMLLLTI